MMILEAKGIVKKFGGVIALNKVDVSVMEDLTVQVKQHSLM